MQVKKNPQAEIGRNSSLYFAIGLNIMLFITWQALEFKTYDKADIDIGMINLEKEVEEEIPIININTPPPPPPPVVLTETVQIVEDIEDIEETVIESTEVSQDDRIADVVVNVRDVAVTEVEEEVEVPFAIIEDVPIFPGCENVSKAQKRACFEQKIQAHVVKHFQYPQVALELGIHGRVSVMFTIDKDGSITKIRTRGPDKTLENEAVRIINTLPKMIPGKQRGKPVPVPFSLPINFVMAVN
ncbi:energy transducer TonB [Confluentibacter flavum]|uniref:Energy transducer TonB n=1 Tax=Confluentibacter flavum TaxID=1909700 RepID=A0A2N3HM29_9FLAO|nr:energy transducer TonB [Confluentibacter flavum]PKQ46013.1 energy transducer TonB [Confluentibacter flavum]